MWKKLNQGFGEIEPYFDNSGFFIEGHIFIDKLTCEHFKTTFFKLLLADYKRRNKNVEIVNIIKRCRSYLDRSIRSIINFDRKILNDDAKIEKFIFYNFDKKKDKAKIKEFKQIIALKRKLRDEEKLKNFLKKIIEIREIKDKQALKREAKQVFEDYKTLLDKIQLSPFWLFLTYKIGNYAWGDSIIDQILSKDKRRIIFQKLTSLYIGSDLITFYKDVLANILNDIAKSGVNETLKKEYFTYYSYTTKNFLKDGMQFLNDWSESDLKRKLQVPILPIIHLPFWYPLAKLLPNYSDYLSFSSKAVKSGRYAMAPDVLMVLEDYYPKNNARRKLIANELSKLWQSDDPYAKYLFLNIVEKQNYGDYAALGFLKQIPFYMTKRKYYREILEEGHANDFAIYYLVSLGDIYPNLIWWLLI